MSRRPLLLGLLGLVVIVGLAAAAAFSPAVQRWAVLRAVKDSPDLKLQLESVSAGPASATASGVRVERSGVVIEMRELAVDYSLFALVSGRGIDVNRLSVLGLNVDLSRAATAAEASAASAPAAAAAPGVLGHVTLPMAVTIGRFDIEGTAVLPGAEGRAPVRAKFNVTGSGIAPGSEGTVRLDATVTDPSTGGQPRTLTTDVEVKLTQSAKKTFDRITLSAVASTNGLGLTAAQQIKLSAELSKTGTGEAYALSVDTLIGGRAENLLSVNAALPAGGREFAGDWRVEARRSQVAPFFLGGKLPSFEVKGGGKFTFDPETADATIEGSLDADVREFEAFDPALRAIGSVSIGSSFDVSQKAGLTRLGRLDLRVSGERPVLELQTTQPAEISISKERIQVSASSAGEILRVKLSGLPVAWARPFVAAYDVSGGALTGELAIVTDGQQVVAQTLTPLAIDELNVVQRGEALLLKAALETDLEAKLTAQAWQANLRRLSLRTAAGDRLQAQAEMAGQFSDVTNFTARSRYEADLPELLKPWSPWGHLKSRGEADVSMTGTVLTVSRWTERVTDRQGAPLVSADTLEPFKIDTGNLSLLAAGLGGGDLLRVTFGRVPLDFFAAKIPELPVRGALEGGELVIGAADNRIRFRSEGPLRVTGFGYLSGGTELVKDLSIELSPKGDLDPAADINVSSGKLKIRGANGVELAMVDAEGGVTPGKGARGAMKFQLNLPALGSQPIAAQLRAFTQGRASGEVRAAVGEDSRQIEARLTVNGLTTQDPTIVLPVVNVSLRAAKKADGSMTLEAPILFDRSGVRSDLNLSAALSQSGSNRILNAHLTSSTISADDLVAIAGAFTALPSAPSQPARSQASAPAPRRSVQPAQAAATPPVVADVAPAWKGTTAAVTLDLESVSYGTNWAVSGVSGRLTIDGSKILLSALDAAFGEKGRLAAKAELLFVPGAQEPYRLAGDFSLTEFDVTPVFQAIDPSRPPTVEGAFTVTGQFKGAGRTVGEVGNQTQGEFQLTSRQGVFRGLKRGTEKVSVATKAVEIGAALGSIFGSDRVRETAERVAGNAYFADQLAQELGELKYDQLAIRLVRDESLDIRLNSVSVISPEVRLTGAGSVAHVKGQPLLEQPLNVELTLATRGKIEQLFGKARLLDVSRDELGYTRTKYPVVVGGTMARPDVISFYSRLAAAKLIENLVPEN